MWYTLLAVRFIAYLYLMWYTSFCIILTLQWRIECNCISSHSPSFLPPIPVPPSLPPTLFSSLLPYFSSFYRSLMLSPVASIFFSLPPSFTPSPVLLPALSNAHINLNSTLSWKKQMTPHSLFYFISQIGLLSICLYLRVRSHTQLSQKKEI